MTKMPILDKGSAVQNILSVKGTKQVSSPETGSFDRLLRQSTRAAGTGLKENAAANKAENVKKTESPDDTEGETVQEQQGSGKAEDTTKEKEVSAETAQDSKDAGSAEDVTEDAAVLEKAGGEMAAALAAQLGVPEEALREAVQEMGMSDISLLQPENVKELMIAMTEGADKMSLITDGDFYDAVTEALQTLDNVLEEAGEALEISPEELKTALAEGGAAREMPAEVQEKLPEAVTLTGNPRQEAEPESKIVKAPEPEVQLSDEARTQEAPEPERQQAGEDRQDTGKESENPFLQNSIQHQSVEGQAQVSAAETESRFSMTNAQEVMDQILDYMKVSVRPEVSDLEMQLHPESLGNLHIHLSSKEGVVTAQFTAQNEDVRAVLESQMMELKANLEAQGVKVEAVEVAIAQYSLDREPDGNGSQAEQERPKKKGVRNLNLNEISVEDEELTQEEKLTAEVMQSEGSTVSYTA